MSAHVPPHRWADAWAGRVDEREHAAMNRHADRCRECARVRTRIRGASDSFTAIRGLSSPELPWDTVRARVHWSVSSERRAARRAAGRERSSGKFAGRIALGAFASGAVALAIVTGQVHPEAPQQPATAPAPAPPVRGPEASAPGPALAGLVNRATGEVMLDGIRRADLFARELGPGTVIATGAGRVDVQFADASAFALGPHSRLELRRFDASTVELVLDGTIDVEVAPRTAQQRFAVIAGERTIEVRGTQFRVRHAAAVTSVACRHGLVAVRDRSGSVDVAAAHRVDLAPGTAGAVQPLSADELGALAAATPLRLPVWNLDTLRHSSAPLEIAAGGVAWQREIRVDGVELGTAPLRIRVMPGRHTVEASDAAGRFRRAGWVDVVPPGKDPNAARPARFEVPAEPPLTRDISERRRQLKLGVDRAKLRQCMRQIAKQGLTGTYVQIELAVDAAGAVNFLNIIDTDLGSATASCVRNVLADVRFGTGGAATWRERIDL